MFSSPEAANERALRLRGAGDAVAAIDACRAATVQFPRDTTLLVNLAFMLDERGDLDGALRAYDDAIACDERLLEALVAKGLLLLRAGRNDEAETALLRAVAVDACEVRANLALYELLHVKGDPARAVTHQRRALERQTLFSAVAPQEQRSVLVLCTPGDLQANIPVDFLFDLRTTSVHKLYLLDVEQIERTRLPRYDVVFNAIAESPDALPALSLADAIRRAQDKPYLNRPERVLSTNRLELVDALRATPCALAPIVPATRDTLRAGSPLPFPVIVRPVGSHAGHGLERIENAQALGDYLAREVHDTYYVSAFVDYRSADGYYRKYRVILVDGEPYPCHLAISPNWMIHYYNAAMAEHAWMREEEARFLGRFEDVFHAEHRAALRSLAASLDLEYVGVDCTINPDGRLLVFEADPAMVVHASDPVDLYPYKREFVPRIFRAVERMIDARIPVPAGSR